MTCASRSMRSACSSPALRDTGLGPEQRAMVENIDRPPRSVSRLFRSLLDISTLDSGKLEPKSRPVAIGELIADVAPSPRARLLSIRADVLGSGLNQLDRSDRIRPILDLSPDQLDPIIQLVETEMVGVLP